MNPEGSPLQQATSGRPAPLSTEDVTRIVRELLAQGKRELFDAAVFVLAERALILDDQAKHRSLKGAIGQKHAADERRKRIVRIAKSLIDSRRFRFSSYRQLAEIVKANAAMEESVETIRKHLASVRLLEGQNNG